MSTKIIVKNKRSYEILNREYGVSPYKIELIVAERADNPFDRDAEWFQIGRQYWQFVSEQLHQYADNLRSFQASSELSVLFGQ